MEEVFEVWDKDVVERSDETYTEVQRNHQHQRNGVVPFGSLNSGNRIFSCDSNCHFVPLSVRLRLKCIDDYTDRDFD